MTPNRVIDGEIVDAPRVLAAAPDRPVDLVCARHHRSVDCGLARPDCIQYAAPVDEPDDRTWTERMTTYRVVDRRRTHRL